MKSPWKKLLICLFSFCIIGCQSNHYVLVIYEREPIEISLQQQKVEEFQQFIDSIKDNSKKTVINEIPKGPSYIIKNNDKEEYCFTGSYLFHNKDCYIIDDYRNTINRLKAIFMDGDS